MKRDITPGEKGFAAMQRLLALTAVMGVGKQGASETSPLPSSKGGLKGARSFDSAQDDRLLIMLKQKDEQCEEEY